jgi:hypothetical protein
MGAGFGGGEGRKCCYKFLFRIFGNKLKLKEEGNTQI